MVPLSVLPLYDQFVPGKTLLQEEISGGQYSLYRVVREVRCGVDTAQGDACRRLNGVARIEVLEGPTQSLSLLYLTLFNLPRMLALCSGPSNPDPRR
jgi:hypothetical protein